MGAMVRARGEIYKEVAQAVLLYGSENWVVTREILNFMTTFHYRAVRRIMGMTAKRGAGGEWEYPVVEESMDSAGIQPIVLYIKKR